MHVCIVSVVVLSLDPKWKHNQMCFCIFQRVLSGRDYPISTHLESRGSSGPNSSLIALTKKELSLKVREWSDLLFIFKISQSHLKSRCSSWTWQTLCPLFSLGIKHSVNFHFISTHWQLIRKDLMSLWPWILQGCFFLVGQCHLGNPMKMTGNET